MSLLPYADLQLTKRRYNTNCHHLKKVTLVQDPQSNERKLIDNVNAKVSLNHVYFTLWKIHHLLSISDDEAKEVTSLQLQIPNLAPAPMSKLIFLLNQLVNLKKFAFFQSARPKHCVYPLTQAMLTHKYTELKAVIDTTGIHQNSTYLKFQKADFSQLQVVEYSVTDNFDFSYNVQSIMKLIGSLNPKVVRIIKIGVHYKIFNRSSAVKPDLINKTLKKGLNFTSLEEFSLSITNQLIDKDSKQMMEVFYMTAVQAARVGFNFSNSEILECSPIIDEALLAMHPEIEAADFNLSGTKGIRSLNITQSLSNLRVLNLCLKELPLDAPAEQSLLKILESPQLTTVHLSFGNAAKPIMASNVVRAVKQHPCITSYCLDMRSAIFSNYLLEEGEFQKRQYDRVAISISHSQLQMAQAASFPSFLHLFDCSSINSLSLSLLDCHIPSSLFYALSSRISKLQLRVFHLDISKSSFRASDLFDLCQMIRTRCKWLLDFRIRMKEVSCRPEVVKRIVGLMPSDRLVHMSVQSECLVKDVVIPADFYENQYLLTCQPSGHERHFASKRLALVYIQILKLWLKPESYWIIPDMMKMIVK